MERKAKMTKQEKAEWDNLYNYVKKEILQYDNSQSIPPTLVLRLKGLATGKYIENKKIEDRAKYSFKIILYTFQICKPKIIYAICGKEFKNEANKFNYICKIVENNINDVYNRVKMSQKNQEKTETISTENLYHSGAEYKKKSKEIKSNKLEDLW